MTTMFPVRLLAAVAFPGRSDAKESTTLWHWCLHLFMWTGLIAGMAYLNRWGNLERLLRSPWPMLHPTWLPMFGVLIYVLSWLSRGLWLSLRRDALVGVWPDLESAWNETRSSLERAKINFRETPLFLVLGPLTRDLQALLESLGAAAIAHRTNGPFHVFAHREALFVVCANLARLGTYREPSSPGWPGTEAPEASSARLHHLCQLLAWDRPARLPVQGIVLVVPYAATQNSNEAAGVISEAQHDLSIIRGATGVEAPLYLAISGLTLPTSGAVPQNWFQRFPPLPDLDPAEIRSMYHEGVDWLCSQQIAKIALALFRVEAGPTEANSYNTVVRDNIRTYQWLCAAHTGRARLKEMLVDATQNEYSEPSMVAGCYVLSGAEAKLQSPLAQVLLEDLLAHQHAATWTVDRLAMYSEQRRQTWFGYGLGVLAITAVMVGAGWLLLLR